MAKKKKQNPTSTSFVTVVILVAIIIGGIAYLVGDRTSENAVISINGEVVTEEEIAQAYQRLPQQYQLFFSKEDVIEQLTNQKLLLQEAAAQGITIDAKAISEQIDELRLTFSSEEEFQEALSAQNISLEDIEKQIREQLTINTLLNESVASEIKVTRKDLESYYEENIDLYKADPGEIRAAHVLLETREEALVVKDLLEEGAEFGTVATTYSTDASAAINRGQLGFFGKGVMVEEFEKAAFSLSVGEISEPVQTTFGYHIIQRLPGIISFSDVEAEIESLMQRELQVEQTETFLSSLEEKASIIRHDLQNSFSETGDELCEEDGKPIVRRYSSSTCDNCPRTAFITAVGEFDVVVKDLELDSGNDLITAETESTLSAEEFEILKKYNPQGAVPAYVFGCKYVRIGNAFENNLAGEEKQFLEILGKL